MSVNFPAGSPFPQQNINPNVVPFVPPGQKNRPSTKVAEASPSLYSAAVKTGLSDDESRLIENWAIVSKTNKRLLAMSNADAAKEYDKLSPDLQAYLQLYYGVDYANKPENTGLITDPTSRKLLGIGQENFGLADLKNPLKFLLTLGSKYYKFVNTPGNYTLAQAFQGGDYSQTRLDDAYNGENMFNPEYVNPLIEKHGGEKSYIAIKLLSGMTPGEIIDSWGPNDPAMIDAMSSFFNNEEESKTILTEFQQAQLSPGRIMAHDMFDRAGVDIEKHKTLFNVQSGVVDAIYQVAIDPLTYMTGGVAPAARGLRKLAKGAETFEGAALTISQHFANPKNRKVWEGFSGRLKEYADAWDSNNIQEASRIRSEIRDQYPEFANDYLIQDMAVGENRITDVASAQNYFQNMENASKLFRGRVDGILYLRENAMTMRRMRNMRTGIRLKTREFFKGETNFDVLDKIDLNTFFDDFVKLGEDMDGGADVSRIYEAIDATSKKGIRKTIEFLSSRAVPNKPIFTADETFNQTLGLLRQQAYVALGSKALAEAAAVKYSKLGTQAERVAFRKALDEMTMRRMGLDKVSGGKDFMVQILNSKYGFQLGGDAYAAAGQLEVPAHFKGATEATYKPVTGTLLPFQNTDAIGWLPMREIKEFMAARTFERIENKADVLPKLFGGLLDSKTINVGTDIWSLFTLYPRLGVRTAIDEGFIFSLYANGGALSKLISARKANKIATAVTGSDAGIGPVKSLAQRTTNAILSRLGASTRVGAKQFMTLEERIVAKENIYDEFSEQLRSGTMTQSDVERIFEDRLITAAIDRFSGRGIFKMTPTEISDMRSLMDINPHAFEDVSAGKLKEVLIGRGNMVRTEPSLMDTSTLTRALKEEGFEHLTDYVVNATKGLDDNQLALAMFRNFYLGFATRPYKFSNGSFANPATIFVRRNGLATAKDYENAVKDMMFAVGFVYDTKTSKYIVGNQKVIDEFLNQSRSTIRDANAEQSAVALDYIESVFSDLYFRFHGSSNTPNKKLLDYFKSKADEAGNPMPAFRVVQEMDFDTYRNLTSHIPKPEQIRTDIDFSKLTKNMIQQIAENGVDGMWNSMTRITDGFFRQPAVRAIYLALRDEYRPFQKELSNQYFRGMSEKIPTARRRKMADELAEKVYATQAAEDAMHTVLKYADNPEVRSIFIDNYRNLGRFTRATEDFGRRMYRLVREHGLSATYRMKLMTTGLSAAGFVHTDDNDKSYVILPMDDALFHAVDTTLRTLSRDKLSVNQPLFNDVTFKLSAGNPSFQDDAGVPYLSGPLAALSVLGIKSIMGNFDATKGMAEDLDNALLGNIGDNVTVRSAVVPRSIQLLFNLMNPDEKSRQMTTATMQAIAYNQANGYGINPVNYVNADGTVDNVRFERDKAQYLKDVQITAHNILWLRSFLGLLSPIAPTLQDSKQLPDYMKEVGMTSMKSSFFDVLDDVERMYPDAKDPYELALGMWTGDNRGKLAYLPSRNNSDVSVVMSYSYAMQDWLLKHNDLVDEYGSAAVIFAPNTGEFSPGVYNWARAAELIESKDVGDYLDEVLMQDTINAYFDLDDQETAELQNVVSADVRRQIINRYTELKQNMTLSVPYLAERLQNMADNEAKAQFLNNVYSIANMSDVDIPTDTRNNVNEAYDIYNNFITSVERPEIKNAENSAAIKRFIKQDALDQLDALAERDQSGIVKQLIRVAFKGLMNAKSRDAQNTIR